MAETAVMAPYAGGAAPAATGLRSPAFIQRLTRAALERVHVVGDGKTIDAGELRTNGGILAAIAAAAFLITMFGPPVLRHGVRLVAVPWNNSEPASLFSILVEPGNVTVPKGGDELLEARLRGFQSDNVELLVRGADSANWTRLPMMADTAGRYAYRLFDIAGKMQYAVEANGVRSTTYTPVANPANAVAFNGSGGTYLLPANVLSGRLLRIAAVINW